ncbi:MAG: cobalt ECF transporter T component CbiQ [Thermostichus sp. HHBFW_bins_43]
MEKNEASPGSDPHRGSLALTICPTPHSNSLSWIHRWRPLPKLLGLLALVVAFASVQRLAVLPLIGAIAAGLWGLSGLPWGLGLRRLALPGLLVMGLIGILPFWVGETVIWRWGSLALRWEGIETVLRIGGRLLAIFTLSLLLLETTPPMELFGALRRLGIPELLLELAWLTQRYLQEISAQWGQMRRAAQLRGWQPGGSLRRDLPLLASLVGTLLIRSYERAERVYQALRLRGYGQAPSLLPPDTRRDPYSWAATKLALVTAMVLVGLQWI